MGQDMIQTLVIMKYNITNLDILFLTEPAYVVWQSDILYENGTWYKIATQDVMLFDQNTKKETVGATQLTDKIKTQVSNAHKGAGGNAGGYTVHPSVNTRGQPSPPMVGYIIQTKHQL